MFHERGPDIVVTNGGPCDLKKPVIRMRNDWYGLVLKGIYDEPRFLSLYVPVVIASPAMLEGGEAFSAWAARRFVEHVKDNVYIKPIE